MFSEIKRFQVKPDKAEQFEALVREMRPEQGKQPGCEGIVYVRRSHTYDTIENPPHELTRIVKCVRFASCWRFNTLEQYYDATKWYFATFGKRVFSLLIQPFDIECGREPEE